MMATAHEYNRYITKKYLVFFFLLFFSASIYSQPSRADSLRQRLEIEEIDTNRVRLMWQLASAVSSYNPDTALLLSQQSLFLAKRIKYTEGISRSLGVVSNTFIKISNYPRALEFNLEKLKIEEKRNNPRNLSSVLMNIGVTYALQEEYIKALEYYRKADSVINKYNVELFRYNIALNVGDAYNRLNISDSSYKYFDRSLVIAKQLDNGDFIGTSMTGLGHSYYKLGLYEQSLLNYKTGIRYLQDANDDEVLCEAALGLARLFDKINQSDSAERYAVLSFSIAEKDGFLSQQLDAGKFLANHYQQIKNIDSAFHYIKYVQQLNDSVNSKSRIREAQILSSDEQYRQLQLEESRRLARQERKIQLQMLAIGIFIPGLFLLTLSLRKVKIHVRIIRLLGILSLLFFFEYLTLLLHPTVANLTNHTPVLEILIFVVVASFLIPAHHRIEHWFIQKLVQKRKQRMEEEEKPPATDVQPINEMISTEGDRDVSEAEAYLAEENRPPADEKKEVTGEKQQVREEGKQE